LSAISGLRYYSAELGRWASRDPLKEYSFRVVWRIPRRRPRRSLNVYAFVENSPVGHTDFLGLAESACRAECKLGKEAKLCEFLGFHYSAITEAGHAFLREAREVAGYHLFSMPPVCLGDLVNVLLTYPVSALESAAQGGEILITAAEEWWQDNLPVSMYLKYAATHCDTPCPCSCGMGSWGERKERMFFCMESPDPAMFNVGERRKCFYRWKTMCGNTYTVNGLFRYDMRTIGDWSGDLVWND
jgi:RHS repeat-associated protein